TRTQGAGILVAGLYVLREPLAVQSDAAQGEAMDLMRRLALAVGADGIEPGVMLGDLSFPLPGSANRELPVWQQLAVDCLVAEESHPYAVEDLQAFSQEL